MNNQETQPKTSTKEMLKKASQYTATFLGASALTAAGILTLSNPDKAPATQHKIVHAQDGAPNVIPGTVFDTLKGTQLVDAPQPRRSDVSQVEESPAHNNPSVTTESQHSTVKSPAESTKDKHTNTNHHFGADAVVLPPPTEAPAPVETPSPSETPTPIIVP